jgi:hypothetical protein
MTRMEKEKFITWLWLEIKLLSGNLVLNLLKILMNQIHCLTR